MPIIRLDSVIVFKMKVLFFNRRQILIFSFKIISPHTKHKHFGLLIVVVLWHEVISTQSGGRLIIYRLNDDISNSLRNKYSKFTVQILKVLKFELHLRKDNSQLVYVCKLKKTSLII